MKGAMPGLRDEPRLRKGLAATRQIAAAFPALSGSIGGKRGREGAPRRDHDRGRRALLFRLGGEEQRIALALAEFGRLLGLGLGDVAGGGRDAASAFLV